MKNVAPNIHERKGGYLVRLKRQDVTRSYWVRKTTPRALACAIRIRNSVAMSPPRNQKARSNTGMVGISEGTFWRRGRGYPCFVVSWRVNDNIKRKRIMYGPSRSRKQALKMAVKIRKANQRREIIS